MFKLPKLALLAALFSVGAQAASLGFGTPASDNEIAGWDIDIRPDGMGLPPGGGTAEQGEPLYEAKCAMCHGSFGEGAGRWPVLAGGEGSLTEERPEKTVGSYWPYASTLWDYIHRAMPYPQPQSLSDDEVYKITAYVLYLNDIIDYDFELSQASFAEVEMPNQDSFYVDDRPDVVNARCFEDCADPAAMTIVGTIGGLSPTGHFKEDSGVSASHYGDSAPEASTATKVSLSEVAVRGQGAYDQYCAACHGSGVAGAPKVGDQAAWSGRISQGLASLVEHAIQGYQGDAGYMPPKGGFTNLADDVVADAVSYMAESSQ
ncbi:c-type cytochrome [Litorivicinus lipolyticus]|uniref:C-type cytochrome n=1 Tax=Litorivicinus lipolyticus TaxID=418701 RepID=A0A5Q2QCJ8_9GAMM|nr:c-type cytochrome [Litorivicinus lipolyticus]QGG80834.1 c-type cytochrome [Litorivicinus lipolyticus]